MKNLEVDPFNEENWNVNMWNLVGSEFLNIYKDEVFYEDGRFSDETQIELIFDNHILKFDGFLFDRRNYAIGKIVQYVYDQSTLGFIALSQVRFLNLDVDDYRQAYIGFEIGDEKLELLIVYRNAEIIDK